MGLTWPALHWLSDCLHAWKTALPSPELNGGSMFPITSTFQEEKAGNIFQEKCWVLVHYPQIEFLHLGTVKMFPGKVCKQLSHSCSPPVTTAQQNLWATFYFLWYPIQTEVSSFTFSHSYFVFHICPFLEAESFQNRWNRIKLNVESLSLLNVAHQ